MLSSNPQEMKRGGSQRISPSCRELLQKIAKISGEHVAPLVSGGGETAMQQLQLVSFALAMPALVVCGWVFARKPRKPTLRPEPDERQPGCFALEEEKGGNWKGSGGTAPTVKEAKPSL
jgi:hypothetical protein